MSLSPPMFSSEIAITKVDWDHPYIYNYCIYCCFMFSICAVEHSGTLNSEELQLQLRASSDPKKRDVHYY